MRAFCRVHGTGKLFRSSDLPKLARYMITFYDEQPVDWLLRIYRLSMAQPDIRMRKPTLFQHMGLKSSFDTSQDNKLKDRFFEAGEKRWHSDDPPAHVFTTMTAYGDNVADLAYASGGGFFWIKDPKEGQHFTIIFDNDEPVKRIYCETGTVAHPTDLLKAGKLEIGFSRGNNTIVNSPSECVEWKFVGEFQSGRIESEKVGEAANNRPIRCVRVVVEQTQTEWIALKQLAVFVTSK